jgi:predicted MPP superfamily phosphohydrolase
MPLSRRSFLKLLRNTLLISGASAIGGTAYVTQIEPRWLSLERRTLAIPQLPAAFEGFRIVQLSDLHLNPTPLDHIRRAVEAANQLKPDLVVVTGDFVYHAAEDIFDLAPVVAQLNAAHGVYTVLGNHDLWTNTAIVQQGLAESHIPLLLNRGVPLTRGASTLYLAGVDDAWSGQPDYGAAMSACPTDAPTIMLLHEPDFADTTANDPRMVLQLSGHSHGGQVRLPFIGAIALPPYGKKYQHGLYQVQKMWLYTNRGIGSITPAVRFNCPPEITEITLTQTL